MIKGWSHAPKDVCLDILDIFQADSDPDKPVGYTGFRPLFRRQPAVRGGRGMRDRGLGITQVGGDGEHARGIDQLPALFPAAFQFERQQAAEG